MFRVASDRFTGGWNTLCRAFFPALAWRILSVLCDECSRWRTFFKSWTPPPTHTHTEQLPSPWTYVKSGNHIVHYIITNNFYQPIWKYWNTKQGQGYWCEGNERLHTELVSLVTDLAHSMFFLSLTQTVDWHNGNAVGWRFYGAATGQGHRKSLLHQ